MVEVFAVASGKGGTGKTTSTVALGMALADEYDVTIIDADTGMANLLFHTGLANVEVTLHDLLIEDRDCSIEEACYNRHGMRILPCGTSLEGFQNADPEKLQRVVANLATDTDIILLDSPATLGSKNAVLPIVLADRTITVLQPTVPAVSDGLKVREYARSYGTGSAGVLFNQVTEADSLGQITDRIREYFDGPILGTVSDSDAVREARSAGRPVLEHAPESPAATAYRRAAAELSPTPRDIEAVANRFSQAIIPDSP